MRLIARRPLGGCSGGVLRTTAVQLMRFDHERQPGPPSASAHDPSVTPNTALYDELPESMRPKRVSAYFTPFPLPKYDTDMGFGPVRLSDIPDVEVARQRVVASTGASAAAAAARRPALDELDDLAAAALADSLVPDGFDGAEARAGLPVPPQDRCGVSEALEAPSDAGAAADLDELGGGYRVDPTHFPIMDILRCERSLDDLLAQFMQRPAREARTASVLDLANTMARRTDAELERMFYELGALFTVDGAGLQFLAAKVVKYGRAYYAADELMKAFIHLVDAATETLVQEQPDRLVGSPALLVQLVHFLAQIKIFEPNLWYSPNPNAPANRADYSHARGVNTNIAHQRTGEELYDYMVALVVANDAQLLDRCTDEQLVDLLAGFGAVMPGGLPEGEVANAILDVLHSRWETDRGGVLDTAADAELLERLYLILSLFHVQNDTVLEVLLSADIDTGDRGCPSGGGGSEGCPSPLQRRDAHVRRPLRFAGEARTAPRGPDFFAALAREKRSGVQARAVAMLECSIRRAKAGGAEMAPLLAALAESGHELLLGMGDKAAALAVAARVELDEAVLRSTPEMATVAARLVQEAAGQEPLAGAVSRPRDVQRGIHDALATSAAPSRAGEAYVTRFAGKRVHPIRTLLRSVPYVNSLDNVFLVHSSIVGGAVEALVAAARRGKSGKDALIVTASCLRAIAVRAHYSRTQEERDNAQRALTILAYEVESGRSILVPPSEEIAVHDAGVVCDEDLMLWTLAAFFAREMPLLRVNTLMSARTTARDPHKHLKGEHSPLTATMDLYNADAPLLQSLRSKELRSVTHHVRLQRRVRDKVSRVHEVDPSRARFVYRRDKAMFDKYHVTARHLAPGFSRGALNSDLRGLGIYTPDHPQVGYRPLRQKVARRPTAASAALPWVRAVEQPPSSS